MKRILLSLIALATLSVALPAQTVTANLTITFSAAVMADINTHWLDQTSGSLGLLADPLSATDTSVTLASAVPVMVGSAVLIEKESMTVLAVNGAILTVSRGMNQTTPTGTTQFPLTTATAHAANTEVFFLKYATPWAMLSQEALLDWAQGITKELGARSATFANSANGSVTTN